MGCARRDMAINLVSPHRKVPGLRTPRPFISRPEALSHSLRVGNMRDSGTQTFSTKKGPTASSTDVPLDKDELNSTPPHVGQIGLAATLQKHYLPFRRTEGIGTPRLAQLVTQRRLAAMESWPHKGATYGTFLRNRPPRHRDYSRMGEKAKNEDVTTKE
jgi:hypothetical protein